MNQCGHCEQQKPESNLKLCGRCRGVRYCSLKCQRDSWVGGHAGVCRQKTCLDDEVPLEVRDKPWTHEFLCVRNFLRDNCKADAKELKQLTCDEELVHDLYVKIFAHKTRSNLKESEIDAASASSTYALNCRSQHASSYAAKAVVKDSLPPPAAEALKDLCSAAQILQTPLLPPPHSDLLREAVVSVFNESTDLLLKMGKINRENLELKEQIFRATKASASLSDVSDLGAKAINIKSNQGVISQMEKKSVEYERKIADSTKDLGKAGFKERFTHDKIVADAEALAAKREEMEELKSRVSAFHGLPADLPLAKVKLAEKKRTLSELGEKCVDFF